MLYADTATTPTALAALNLALFYGSCEHNAISLSDAVQAFLQAPTKEETWVIVPYELWLEEWKTKYPKGRQAGCSTAALTLWAPTCRKAMGGILVRQVETDRRDRVME